jgi:hypothetical protein
VPKHTELIGRTEASEVGGQPRRLSRAASQVARWRGGSGTLSHQRLSRLVRLLATVQDAPNDDDFLVDLVIDRERPTDGVRSGRPPDPQASISSILCSLLRRASRLGRGFASEFTRRRPAGRRKAVKSSCSATERNDSFSFASIRGSTPSPISLRICANLRNLRPALSESKG